MQATQFNEGDRVLYVPSAAQGNPQHPSCAKGVVMDVKGAAIHVMFAGDLHTKPCDPSTLQVQ
jgi:hypothetical protein